MLDNIEGKVHPHSKDMEEAVLGALMLEQESWYLVNDRLNADYFYFGPNQMIYNAIENLHQISSPVDLLTVTEYLKKYDQLDKVGGPYYLTQLTSRVASATNIMVHATIVFERYMQREMIKVGHELHNIAFDDYHEAETFITDSLNRLESIMSGVRAEPTLTERIKQIIEVREAALKNSNSVGITGISTGLKILDQYTNGWQPGSLVVIGAVPSMGKTSIAVNRFTKTAIELGHDVSIVAMDDEPDDIIQKLFCSYGVDSDRQRLNQLTPEDLNIENQAIGYLTQKEKLHFIEEFELRKIVRKIKIHVRRHKSKIIIVDYLQQITVKGYRGNDAMEIITQTLKQLAKKLKVTIIALSQLSRDVMKRQGDKRAVLSDLRQSGSIEQDANIVLFPYREVKFDPDCDYPERCELQIAKNKKGPTGRIYFRSTLDMSIITDYKSIEIVKDRTESQNAESDFNF